MACHEDPARAGTALRVAPSFRPSGAYAGELGYDNARSLPRSGYSPAVVEGILDVDQSEVDLEKDVATTVAAGR